ncbi:hypothetical protein FRC08_001137 [Ceratobasidium sp. 394]|nr:hypothetical protein FRC08_001137 [Ceratobasidium sp. 394]
MKTHLNQVHPTVSLDQRHSSWEIPQAEVERMEVKWSSRHPKRRSNKQAGKIEISDAHMSDPTSQSTGVSSIDSAVPVQTDTASNAHSENDLIRRQQEDTESMETCLCGIRVSEPQNNEVLRALIRCDKTECQARWFHLGCVGLSEAPETWDCGQHLQVQGPSKRRKTK